MKPDKEQNMLSQDWPQSGQFKKSIRREFSLYVSGIIIILMMITGTVITRQYVDSVTRNMVEKLLVQARAYSGPAGKLIISGPEPDALLLNNICKKLSGDNPDLHWAGIADQTGTYLAHTDFKKVVSGETMKSLKTAGYEDILQPGEAFDASGDSLFIVVPIIEGGHEIGHLKMASSNHQIVAARKASIMTVITITIVMIIIGIPLTMFILHRKLKPISVITGHLRNLDFDDIRLDIPVKTGNELGYLAATLRVMGSKLGAYQKELVEKERISRELEIAREIQANILPRDYPIDKRFAFGGDYRSAREVGGDYYDFIEIDRDTLMFLVADVSGKSLPGMLVMLLTRDLVKTLSRTISHPAEMLGALNHELSLNIKKGMFVTMFVGLLNRNTGHFTYASAGHNPLVYFSARENRTELIKTKGFPLGMMPDAPFMKRIESGRINLAPGDWLIQYTDGVNEAQNESDEEYGMDRFLAAIEKHRGDDPGQFVEALLDEHAGFVGDTAQYDDITLLAMKWNGDSVDINNNRSKEAIDAG